MRPHVLTLILSIACTSAALPAAPATRDDVSSPRPNQAYEGLSTGGPDKFSAGADGCKGKPAATAAQDSSKDVDKVEMPRKMFGFPVAKARLSQREETNGFEDHPYSGGHCPYDVHPKEEDLSEDIVTEEADRFKPTAFGFISPPEGPEAKKREEVKSYEVHPKEEGLYEEIVTREVDKSKAAALEFKPHPKAPDAKNREEGNNFEDQTYSDRRRPSEVHPKEEGLYKEIVTREVDEFKAAAFGVMSRPNAPETKKREVLDDAEVHCCEGGTDGDYDEGDVDAYSREDDSCKDHAPEDYSYDGHPHEVHPYEGYHPYEVHPKEEDLYEDLATGEADKSDVEESGAKESDAEESDDEESDAEESDAEEPEVDESEVDESEVDESEVDESEVDESDAEESDADDSEANDSEADETKSDEIDDKTESDKTVDESGAEFDAIIFPFGRIPNLRTPEAKKKYLEVLGMPKEKHRMPNGKTRFGGGVPQRWSEDAPPHMRDNTPPPRGVIDPDLEEGWVDDEAKAEEPWADRR